MAATKTVDGENYPASDFLVVEDAEKPDTWHLQVKRHGKPDHGLMGGAWAALHGGYRGNEYQGPGKEEAIRKLTALYTSEGMEPPGPASHARIQLNIISLIAFDGAAPRPIHMFRPGAFTDMFGRETAYSTDDVQSIVAHFQVNRRRKPPITERHDFGRALGRIQDVWSDGDGNLYGMPKWNADGRKLLENEVYDGFSCELERTDTGLALIGGSLTNYPAVSGLEPITLEAPPLEAPTLAPPAPLPQARVDTPARAYSNTPQLLQQPMEVLMSDQLEQTTLPNVATPSPATVVLPPVPDAPVAPPLNDPILQGRVDALLSQQQAVMAQYKRDLEASMRAELERQMLATEQRNAINAYARQRTSTTPEQPYAIPMTAEELAQLLLETPSAVRGKWQALLTRLTTSGPLSFDEIGSSGESAEAGDRWNILVNAKVAAGLSKVEAIKAAAAEHPDLYEAQQYVVKKGRR